MKRKLPLISGDCDADALTQHRHLLRAAAWGGYGIEMSVRCLNCGQDNPEGARFCNGCGSVVSALPTDRLLALRAFIPAEVAQKIMTVGGEGERRTVTALFCDIVGSTALGERLGPERFKVVMDQVLGRIIIAVSRYEGTVAQVMGDGLLGFFGAPVAHEDDPERAVRAALDIRDAVAAFARDLQTAYGMALAVRIGLHTGPVVLSRVTDVLSVAYNALGDTVTTAARLQTAASPGTIMASDVTVRLAAPLLEVRPTGPLTLKGKEAPVAAAEVLGFRTELGKPRGVVGLTSPMVGRAREAALLQASVQAVIDGRGQIVAIQGEAGVGKSRLVAEVRGATPQVRWFEGRCLSYAGGIPYFPFLDLLREWLGVTAADPDIKVRVELRAALDGLFGSRAAEVYPYLGAMLRLSLEPKAAAAVADLSPESLQHQTFHEAQEWAERLASRQPLALVLDDLHWADATSLALLEALFEVTEYAPVLLCFLLRPEREHGCWQANEVARRRFPHRHTEIVLQPLTQVDTEHLVSNLLARPDFPMAMRDLILQKAEGNPFFIEEVIRELIEGGILLRKENRWTATRPVKDIDIPGSVQGVLLSRIDRMPAEARRVLQVASVIGRLFSFDLLQPVVGGNGRVQAALVDLQRHNLIVERRRLPQAEYRFSHALTQEVAYSTLLEEERRRTHEEVARALEARYADRLDEVAALLAYHYDAAANEERALHFLVRAGDKSRAQYADDEAIRSYTRALELMKRRGEWEAAAQTLMKVALAHHIAFNFGAANLVYREAFEVLGKLPPPLGPDMPPAIVRFAGREPVGVDSARTMDTPSGNLARNVFEGLLQIAPDMNVAPALAHSWEISADGTRYIFRLHRNRQWSDGHPVTAHDFVFAWLRAMRGPNSQFFHDIVGARAYGEGKINDPASVGVHAFDDYTLGVTLEGPRVYFPFIVAHNTTLPEPCWVIDRYGEDWTDPKHLVSNGPYLITEWERGSHIRLVANPRYTGPRRGNVRDIELIFTKNDDPGPFEQGEVDIQIAASLDADHATRLRHYLHIGVPAMTDYIFFRCDRPPFKDLRLRLAFAHATDRQALVRTGGVHVLPADGGFVPPPFPGHSPHIGVPFDPEKARHLIAEAGYPGGRGLGPFSMPWPQGWQAPYGFEILTRTWKEILGVAVSMTPMPPGEYFRRLADDPPPLGRGAWAPDYLDPDSFLRCVIHSTSISNYGRWASDRFDALVEEAQAVTDHRRRMAIYHEADRLVVSEEVAIIPTVYWRFIAIVQPWVKGWWFTILGPCLIKDLVVELER